MSDPHRQRSRGSNPSSPATHQTSFKVDLESTDGAKPTTTGKYVSVFSSPPTSPGSEGQDVTRRTPTYVSTAMTPPGSPGSQQPLTDRRHVAIKYLFDEAPGSPFSPDSRSTKKPAQPIAVPGPPPMPNPAPAPIARSNSRSSTSGLFRISLTDQFDDVASSMTDVPPLVQVSMQPSDISQQPTYHTRTVVRSSSDDDDGAFLEGDADTSTHVEHRSSKQFTIRPGVLSVSISELSPGEPGHGSLSDIDVSNDETPLGSGPPAMKRVHPERMAQDEDDQDIKIPKLRLPSTERVEVVMESPSRNILNRPSVTDKDRTIEVHKKSSDEDNFNDNLDDNDFDGIGDAEEMSLIRRGRTPQRINRQSNRHTFVYSEEDTSGIDLRDNEDEIKPRSADVSWTEFVEYDDSVSADKENENNQGEKVIKDVKMVLRSNSVEESQGPGVAQRILVRMNSNTELPPKSPDNVIDSPKFSVGALVQRLKSVDDSEDEEDDHDVNKRKSYDDMNHDGEEIIVKQVKKDGKSLFGIAATVTSTAEYLSSVVNRKKNPIKREIPLIQEHVESLASEKTLSNQTSDDAIGRNNNKSGRSPSGKLRSDVGRDVAHRGDYNEEPCVKQEVKRDARSLYGLTTTVSSAAQYLLNKIQPVEKQDSNLPGEEPPNTTDDEELQETHDAPHQNSSANVAGNVDEKKNNQWKVRVPSIVIDTCEPNRLEDDEVAESHNQNDANDTDIKINSTTDETSDRKTIINLSDEEKDQTHLKHVVDEDDEEEIEVDVGQIVPYQVKPEEQGMPMINTVPDDMSADTEEPVIVQQVSRTNRSMFGAAAIVTTTAEYLANREKNKTSRIYRASPVRETKSRQQKNSKPNEATAISQSSSTFKGDTGDFPEEEECVKKEVRRDVRSRFGLSSTVSSAANYLLDKVNKITEEEKATPKVAITTTDVVESQPMKLKSNAEPLVNQFVDPETDIHNDSQADWMVNMHKPQDIDQDRNIDETSVNEADALPSPWSKLRRDSNPEHSDEESNQKDNHTHTDKRVMETEVEKEETKAVFDRTANRESSFDVEVLEGNVSLGTTARPQLEMTPFEIASPQNASIHLRHSTPRAGEENISIGDPLVVSVTDQINVAALSPLRSPASPRKHMRKRERRSLNSDELSDFIKANKDSPKETQRPDEQETLTPQDRRRRRMQKALSLDSSSPYTRKPFILEQDSHQFIIESEDLKPDAFDMSLSAQAKNTDNRNNGDENHKSTDNSLVTLGTGMETGIDPSSCTQDQSNIQDITLHQFSPPLSVEPVKYPIDEEANKHNIVDIDSSMGHPHSTRPRVSDSDDNKSFRKRVTFQYDNILPENKDIAVYQDESHSLISDVHKNDSNMFGDIISEEEYGITVKSDMAMPISPKPNNDSVYDNVTYDTDVVTCTDHEEIQLPMSKNYAPDYEVDDSEPDNTRVAEEADDFNSFKKKVMPGDDSYYDNVVYDKSTIGEGNILDDQDEHEDHQNDVIPIKSINAYTDANASTNDSAPVIHIPEIVVTEDTSDKIQISEDEDALHIPFNSECESGVLDTYQVQEENNDAQDVNIIGNRADAFEYEEYTPYMENMEPNIPVDNITQQVDKTTMDTNVYVPDFYVSTEASRQSPQRLLKGSATPDSVDKAKFGKSLATMNIEPYLGEDNATSVDTDTTFTINKPHTVSGDSGLQNNLQCDVISPENTDIIRSGRQTFDSEKGYIVDIETDELQQRDYPTATTEGVQLDGPEIEKPEAHLQNTLENVDVLDSGKDSCEQQVVHSIDIGTDELPKPEYLTGVIAEVEYAGQIEKPNSHLQNTLHGDVTSADNAEVILPGDEDDVYEGYTESGELQLPNHLTTSQIDGQEIDKLDSHLPYNTDDDVISPENVDITQYGKETFDEKGYKVDNRTYGTTLDGLLVGPEVEKPKSHILNTRKDDAISSENDDRSGAFNEDNGHVLYSGTDELQQPDYRGGITVDAQCDVPELEKPNSRLQHSIGSDFISPENDDGIHSGREIVDGSNEHKVAIGTDDLQLLDHRIGLMVDAQPEGPEHGAPNSHVEYNRPGGIVSPDNDDVFRPRSEKVFEVDIQQPDQLTDPKPDEPEIENLNNLLCDDIYPVNVDVIGSRRETPGGETGYNVYIRHDEVQKRDLLPGKTEDVLRDRSDVEKPKSRHPDILEGEMDIIPSQREKCDGDKEHKINNATDQLPQYGNLIGATTDVQLEGQKQGKPESHLQNNLQGNVISSRNDDVIRPGTGTFDGEKAHEVDVDSLRSGRESFGGKKKHNVELGTDGLQQPEQSTGAILDVRPDGRDIVYPNSDLQHNIEGDDISPENVDGLHSGRESFDGKKKHNVELRTDGLPQPEYSTGATLDVRPDGRDIVYPNSDLQHNIEGDDISSENVDGLRSGRESFDGKTEHNVELGTDGLHQHEHSTGATLDVRPGGRDIVNPNSDLQHDIEGDDISPENVDGLHSGRESFDGKKEHKVELGTDGLQQPEYSTGATLDVRHGGLDIVNTNSDIQRNIEGDVIYLENVDGLRSERESFDGKNEHKIELGTDGLQQPEYRTGATLDDGLDIVNTNSHFQRNIEGDIISPENVDGLRSERETFDGKMEHKVEIGTDSLQQREHLTGATSDVQRDGLDIVNPNSDLQHDIESDDISPENVDGLHSGRESFDGKKKHNVELGTDGLQQPEYSTGATLDVRHDGRDIVYPNSDLQHNIEGDDISSENVDGLRSGRESFDGKTEHKVELGTDGLHQHEHSTGATLDVRPGGRDIVNPNSDLQHDIEGDDISPENVDGLHSGRESFDGKKEPKVELGTDGLQQPEYSTGATLDVRHGGLDIVNTNSDIQRNIEGDVIYLENVDGLRSERESFDGKNEHKIELGTDGLKQPEYRTGATLDDGLDIVNTNSHFQRNIEGDIISPENVDGLRSERETFDGKMEHKVEIGTDGLQQREHLTGATSDVQRDGLDIVNPNSDLQHDIESDDISPENVDGLHSGRESFDGKKKHNVELGTDGFRQPEYSTGATLDVRPDGRDIVYPNSDLQHNIEGDDIPSENVDGLRSGRESFDGKTEHKVELGTDGLHQHEHSTGATLDVRPGGRDIVNPNSDLQHDIEGDDISPANVDGLHSGRESFDGKKEHKVELGTDCLQQPEYSTGATLNVRHDGLDIVNTNSDIQRNIEGDVIYLENVDGLRSERESFDGKNEHKIELGTDGLQQPEYLTGSTLDDGIDIVNPNSHFQRNIEGDIIYLENVDGLRSERETFDGKMEHRVEIGTDGLQQPEYRTGATLDDGLHIVNPNSHLQRNIEGNVISPDNVDGLRSERETFDGKMEHKVEIGTDGLQQREHLTGATSDVQRDGLDIVNPNSYLQRNIQSDFISPENTDGLHFERESFDGKEEHKVEIGTDGLQQHEYWTGATLDDGLDIVNPNSHIQRNIGGDVISPENDDGLHFERETFDGKKEHKVELGTDGLQQSEYSTGATLDDGLDIVNPNSHLQRNIAGDVISPQNVDGLHFERETFDGKKEPKVEIGTDGLQQHEYRTGAALDDGLDIVNPNLHLQRNIEGDVISPENVDGLRSGRETFDGKKEHKVEIGTDRLQQHEYRTGAALDDGLDIVNPNLHLQRNIEGDVISPENVDGLRSGRETFDGKKEHKVEIGTDRLQQREHLTGATLDVRHDGLGNEKPKFPLQNDLQDDVVSQEIADCANSGEETLDSEIGYKVDNQETDAQIQLVAPSLSVHGKDTKLSKDLTCMDDDNAENEQPSKEQNIEDEHLVDNVDNTVDGVGISIQENQDFRTSIDGAFPVDAILSHDVSSISDKMLIHNLQEDFRGRNESTGSQHDELRASLRAVHDKLQDNEPHKLNDELSDGIDDESSSIRAFKSGVSLPIATQPSTEEGDLENSQPHTTEDSEVEVNSRVEDDTLQPDTDLQDQAVLNDDKPHTPVTQLSITDLLTNLGAAELTAVDQSGMGNRFARKQRSISDTNSVDDNVTYDPDITTNTDYVHVKLTTTGDITDDYMADENGSSKTRVIQVTLEKKEADNFHSFRYNVMPGDDLYYETVIFGKSKIRKQNILGDQDEYDDAEICEELIPDKSIHPNTDANATTGDIAPVDYALVDTDASLLLNEPLAVEGDISVHDDDFDKELKSDEDKDEYEDAEIGEEVTPNKSIHPNTDANATTGDVAPVAEGEISVHDNDNELKSEQSQTNSIEDKDNSHPQDEVLSLENTDVIPSESDTLDGEKGHRVDIGTDEIQPADHLTSGTAGIQLNQPEFETPNYHLQKNPTGGAISPTDLQQPDHLIFATEAVEMGSSLKKPNSDVEPETEGEETQPENDTIDGVAEQELDIAKDELQEPGQTSASEDGKDVDSGHVDPNVGDNGDAAGLSVQENVEFETSIDSAIPLDGTPSEDVSSFSDEKSIRNPPEDLGEKSDSTAQDKPQDSEPQKVSDEFPDETDGESSSKQIPDEGDLNNSLSDAAEVSEVDGDARVEPDTLQPDTGLDDDMDGDKITTLGAPPLDHTRNDGWTNRGEEIMRSELGNPEYQKRLDRQDKAFIEGCKKGGFMDGIPLFIAKKGIQSAMEDQAKKSGGRATYSSGVGLLGYMQVEANDRVPKTEFFVPGRMFEVRARHSSNPGNDDDTRLAWRSLALKMSDHDSESPLDLVLQTGNISSDFSADAVEILTNARRKGPEAYKQALLAYPIFLQAVVEGVRKDPDSFYHQFYHSQMTFDLTCTDEQRRLARFRVVPADDSGESGRLTAEEQTREWFNLLLERPENETKPRDYLRAEMKQRVKQQGAPYRLEIQVHDWNEEDGDSNMLYNPSVPWTEQQHPWLHMGTIRLTDTLPDEVIEVTRFNIGNLPEDTLSYPEATSTEDFNSVPALRQEVYTALARQRPKEPTPPPKHDQVQYLVHVVTGSHQNAGNLDAKCNTSVCLIGTEGRTAFLNLQRKLKTDFDKNAKTTFSIIAKYIGEFQCAKIYKDKKGKKSEWQMDYMVVSTPYNKKCHTVPCYRWFTDDTPMLVLRDGNAQVSQREGSLYLRRLRQFELTSRQQLYQWHQSEADQEAGSRRLPGFCAAGNDLTALHLDINTGDSKKHELEWTKHNNGKNSFFKMFQGFFKSRKGKVGVEFEQAVADSLPKEEQYRVLQHVLRNWREDEEFGRQMLCGTMPTRIRRLEEIPLQFPVTTGMVRGQLTPGRTLNDEVEAGRIFLISYPELSEFVSRQEAPETDEDPIDVLKDAIFNSSIKKKAPAAAKEEKPKDKEEAKKETPKDDTKEEKQPKQKKVAVKDRRRYLCAPMVLLLQRQDGSLIPIAIQLTQKAAQPRPIIYTKTDDKGEYSDWLVAKMWVRVAEANVHQYVGHVLGTHLLMEPIALALLRQLPAVHPLHKLLLPHLQGIIANNTIYRKCIITEQGALNEVLALGSGIREGNHLDFILSEWLGGCRFANLSVPTELDARGVLDDGVLPGYHFRDDSFHLWDAISGFVTEILCCYYEDDDQVKNDDELHAMLDDLHLNGFHGRVDMGAMETKADLATFCSIVIFRCTALHSAMSRGMVDMYAYLPNAPPAMMQAPPRTKRSDGYTEAEMKELLPPPELAERYIGAQCLLYGGYEDAEVPLGKYPLDLFTEDRPLNAIRNFQNKLNQISQDIKQRNEALECPYDYLLPDKIPNSIDS